MSEVFTTINRTVLDIKRYKRSIENEKFNLSTGFHDLFSGVNT